MSTGLHLTAGEFDRMAERGAFDHLNRKTDAALDLSDLFA